jgi:serine/threonine protein kinase
VTSELTGTRLGHYAVGELLGRGGMSVVYRAVDERLGRPVALKVINEALAADPEFRSRFVEEARAASAIDHVNIVPIYDVGEVGPTLFIAMRLVDGTDLSKELRRGPLTERRMVALLGQVASALDALHAQGLVHLDVKPANVLLTRNPTTGAEHAYLADFGLTRRGPGGHLTAAGDFLGSPSYASPEHLRGHQVSAASDQYSLACMLFCCLAGHPPFRGTVPEVITAHLRGELPSLSAEADVSPAIDRVMVRGMASDPSFRYPTCGDLIGAARRALAEG